MVEELTEYLIHLTRPMKSVQFASDNVPATAFGWLDPPIRVGRSWLAQATIASGLPLKNRARFDWLITPDRVPLCSLFRNAGWRSAVLLPVVKTSWVEGAGTQRYGEPLDWADGGPVQDM